MTVPSKDCYFPAVEAIAAVTGDGFQDAVLGCGTGDAVIYANNGQGALTFHTELSPYVSDGTYPTVADVNGDGVPDIEVLGGNSIAIYLGIGAGQFAPVFYIGTGPEPSVQIPMDLHGQAPNSGLPDLVVPDSSGRVESLINLTRE